MSFDAFLSGLGNLAEAAATGFVAATKMEQYVGEISLRTGISKTDIAKVMSVLERDGKLKY